MTQKWSWIDSAIGVAVVGLAILESGRRSMDSATAMLHGWRSRKFAHVVLDNVQGSHVSGAWMKNTDLTIRGGYGATVTSCQFDVA